MLKSRTLKLAVAAATIASALGFTGLGATAASAATAHPSTTAAEGSATRPVSFITRQGGPELTAVPDTAGPKCTYGSSSGNVNTCFTIVGHGLYVNYMKSSLCVTRSARWLHQQITGPSFMKNSDQFLFYPGDCPDLTFTVPVNHNVKAGAYHVITWRWNGGQSYTNIGEVTLNVVA